MGWGGGGKASWCTGGEGRLDLFQGTLLTGNKALRPRSPLTTSLVLLAPYTLQGWDERIGHSGMTAVAFGIAEGKPNGNSRDDNG